MVRRERLLANYLEGGQDNEENNFNNLTVGKIADYILEIISEDEDN